MNPIENLEELAREALNDAESLGHPLCSPMKVREASESRAKLFEAISALSGYQPTEGETGRAEVACQACGAAATRRVDEGTAFQGLYCDNCGPGALAFQTVPSAMPVPVDAVRRDQANILRSYATERMRLELPQMWHDLRVVADALTAPPPPMGGEPVGKAIFLVATGEVHEGEETYTRHEGRPQPLCDFEGPLYTSPMGGAAEGWVELVESLRMAEWTMRSHGLVCHDSYKMICRTLEKLAAAPQEGSQP